MSSTGAFEPPEVSDEDIYRVSQLLGLPTNAFYGACGGDPRQAVLKCMGSIDVAACPGSGKTTLLVAKLAILAEKWRDPTRGICVLSHTNAARHEIEKNLGNRAVGQRLLAYPHYIGTIHSFVNEFLALPFLRSCGYRGSRFDTDISGKKLLRLSAGGKNLPGYLYQKIKNEESRIRAVCHAHYIGADLDIRLKAGNVDLKLNRRSRSDAFNMIDSWKKSVLKDGYSSYEDSFAYGYRVLNKYPELNQIMRDRFPLLFIDEAQDNSKEQSEILNRIFVNGGSSVARQRFGDANQAIYDFQGADEAATDRFPNSKKVELPNSYRFGQAIADIADPLGVEPYGLQGIGPKIALSDGSKREQNTIFLFDENSVKNVLDAFGGLLMNAFSNSELLSDWFSAIAVGQVHRPSDESCAHKFPQHIGHYWPDYNPEFTKHDPAPRSFMQHVWIGQGKAKLHCGSHAMVEYIAEGFLRILDLTTDKKPSGRPNHKHRHILQLLVDAPNNFQEYQNLITQFSVSHNIPTEQTWGEHWCGIVRAIAEGIAGVSLSQEAEEFLMWGEKIAPHVETKGVSSNQNNIYLYRKDGREASIKTGSIHSVKGQTHTATLVLDTFFHKRNLEKLLPWLTGKSNGCNKSVGTQQRDRLKLHYVAMTRSTHLLCLSMKYASLSGVDMSMLRSRGWRLVRVNDDGRMMQL